MPKQTELVYQTPEYPRQLRLDTCTYCNAKCLSCHRFLTDRKGGMDNDMILRILKDVGKWENPTLEEIVPVNYGEFFLRSNWLWILQMIAKHLPKTNIVIPTNGSLLNEESMAKLLSIPTVKIINFSVNAFFEETYEQFMGLPASNMKQMETAMLKIKAMRPDIFVVASMVFDPMYSSDYERDSFYHYWKQFAFPQIIAAQSARRPEKKPCAPVIIPCRSLFNDIVIGYDGKLSLCCFDPSFSIDLGEYSGDLHADWHNPKIEAFRKLHNDHKRMEVDICRDCTSG